MSATIDEYVFIYISCVCVYCFSYNHSLMRFVCLFVCLLSQTILYQHQQCWQQSLYQYLCHNDVLPSKCHHDHEHVLYQYYCHREVLLSKSNRNTRASTTGTQNKDWRTAVTQATFIYQPWWSGVSNNNTMSERWHPHSSAKPFNKNTDVGWYREGRTCGQWCREVEDVRATQRREGRVDNGLDRGCVDVVVDDREQLVHNCFIPPHPLLPLQIEQNGHGRQCQDGNTVYIFTTPLLYPID